MSRFRLFPMLCVGMLLLGSCQMSTEPRQYVFSSSDQPLSTPNQPGAAAETNITVAETDIIAMLNAETIATIWETELVIGDDLPLQEMTLNREEFNMDSLTKVLAATLFPEMDADSQVAMFTETFQMQTNYPGCFQVLRLEREIEGMAWGQEEMDSYSDALVDKILPCIGLTGYSVCRTEYDNGSRESVYILEWNGTPLFERFYGTGTDSGVQGTYLRVTVDPYGLEEIYAESLGRPSSESVSLSDEDMFSLGDVIQVCEASVFTFGAPRVQIVNSAELIYYPVDNNGLFNVAWRIETTQYTYGVNGNLASFQIPILIDAVTGNFIA